MKGSAIYCFIYIDYIDIVWYIVIMCNLWICRTTEWYRMPLAAPSALRGEAAQNPSAKVARCLERLQTSPKGKHRKNTKHIKTVQKIKTWTLLNISNDHCLISDTCNIYYTILYYIKIYKVRQKHSKTMHIKLLSVATASVALGADCCTEKSALYRGTTGAEVPRNKGELLDVHIFTWPNRA